MNEKLHMREEGELQEYVEKESSLDGGRRKEVRIVRDADGERQERIVENTGAEHRAILHKISGFIWLVAGVLEALIGLRFLLKLIAANPGAPFVRLVYNVTDLFLWPFAGLTATPAADGMVLEISSLIAMIVYALLFWIVVRLLWLIFSPTRSRRVTVSRREEL